jgi:hypothetical protein
MASPISEFGPGSHTSEEGTTTNCLILLPPELRLLTYSRLISDNLAEQARASTSEATGNDGEEAKPNTLLLLPPELRLKIYSHLLTPNPSSHGRDLLTVLSTSEKMSNDYKEAVNLKKRITAFVNAQAPEAATALADLRSTLQLRHFKLHWDTTQPN